jgi:hypothetical protein
VRATGPLWAAIFAAAVAPAAAEASEAGCRPLVQLTARDPVRAELTLALAERGIEMAPSRTEARCGVVRADVEEKGDGFVVRIADAYGRLDTRTVSRSETAASLIESWVRSDLNAIALASNETAGPDPARVPLRAPQDPPASEATAKLSPEPTARPLVRLAAAAEAYLDNDAQLWAGASATAWFRAGSVYVGPTARFLVLSRKDDDSSFEPNGKMIELLMSAEMPIAIGPATIRPGAGLGGAWSSLSWEPSEEAPNSTEHRVARRGIAPHANVHLSATVAASEGVAIGLGLVADLAPFASPQAVVNGFVLPADPLYFVGLALSVSWEGL